MAGGVGRGGGAEELQSILDNRNILYLEHSTPAGWGRGEWQRSYTIESR